MKLEDVKKANEAINSYNKDYSVRLSIDGEYLILTKNGETAYQDSANEDMYDAYMAVEVFKSIIDEESNN